MDFVTVRFLILYVVGIPWFCGAGCRSRTRGLL